MFGQKKLSDEYAEIISAIRGGDRRTPKHVRPKSIRDSGFESFVTPAHEVLFSDFDWFSPILNSSVSEPWAVEDRAETLVEDLFSDGPDVGRTYAVFYNSIVMGRIQVTVGSGDNESSLWDTSAEYFREHGTALVLIDLDYFRWVPYDEAHSFVAAIERLVGPFEGQNAGYAQASSAATSALTAYLWESVRIEDAVMSFNHRVDGPYDLVRQYAEHWKNEGIDPFERWGGDRPA